jgi:aldehyde dehydrogenase (NAD+)
MNMMADLSDVKRGAVLTAKMRIAGKEVGGSRVIEVRNPYTNAVVGTAPKATVDDVRSAFAIARAYRPKLTRYHRSEVLRKAADLIRDRGEAISDLITAECGIGKKDSRYEVGRACDVFTFAANAAPRTTGRSFRAI